MAILNRWTYWANETFEVEPYPRPIKFIFGEQFPQDQPHVVWSSCTHKFVSEGFEAAVKKQITLSREQIFNAVRCDMALKLQAYWKDPLAWLNHKHAAYCQWSVTEDDGVISLTLESKVYIVGT